MLGMDKLKKYSNYIIFSFWHCFIVIDFGFFFHFELFSELFRIKSSLHFLCHSDAVYSLSLYTSLRKIFCIILPSTRRSSKISLTRFLSIMRAVYLLILLFCQQNDIWWGVQIIKPVNICTTRSIILPFFPFTFKYSPTGFMEEKGFVMEFKL
jgi:hypothetical protein